MPLLTDKKATSKTPQVVTLIVDDSNSMQGVIPQSGKSKAQIATDSIQDMVITIQANNLGTAGFRFLINVAKFGDKVTPIAEAQRPEDVDLNQLVFRGDSGWTVMADALAWAHGALEKALAACRKLPVYDEANSPPPLVVFFTDGENTGPAIEKAAEKLRSVGFTEGKVSVIACGIGMQADHLHVLRTIASNPEFAMNIDPSRLQAFIAAVGATMMHDDKGRQLETFVPDNWDAQMALGRAAMSDARWDDAEKAYTAALSHVHNAGDHRLAATLTALAELHTARGDWASGLPYTKDALALLAKLGPTTALGPGLEAAVGLAELLEIAGEEEEAKNAWLKIAGIWESSAADGLSGHKGKLAAVGFRDLREDRFPGAKAALEQVAASGGPGALAALKGLARIADETSGRAAAEPYLERLVTETVARFKDRHPLARKAIADLRSSYLVGGQMDKVRELDRKYTAR